MMKRAFQAWYLSFSDIFSLKNDEAKGRTINLVDTLLAAIYNVFITGIFYTGFLSMYDISITGVGIITFIPQIANIFSIFSSKILGRFKKRKAILVASKIYFYFMYIVATTIMPQFVTDPDWRLVWFAIILFLGHAVYAPFSPGFTVWFYNFFPKDNDRRTRYLTLLQMFSSVMSSFILLASGVITDAVANSPYQDTLILMFRYFAFVLVLVETIIQSRAKEYPVQESPNAKLSDIFTLPFKYRKFLYCMLMMFAWNYIANLNNGLWNYYLLNHMKFSYTLINTMSVLYTVILLSIAGLWRKILRKYGWIKTFGLTVLWWLPTELFFFFMTPDRPWMYVPLGICQHILSVGLNFSYSNILYMNLPEENSTAHISFHTIGCNVFAFLGLMTGTYVSSITGDNTVPFLGMQVYSVQFTVLLRFVTMLALGIVMVKKWKSFTRDEDIVEIEDLAAMEKRHSEVRRQQRKELRAQRREMRRQRVK